MDPLHRKIAFYKSLLIIFFLGILFVFIPAKIYLFWNFKIKEYQRQKKLPHYQEVMRIIEPLEYSGLRIFVQKEVSLIMDFEKKTFTLNNVHKFTPDGKIVLENGRYGLCGELSTYVYQQIKPVFAGEYSIDFVRVLESGYFFTPQSSHTILLLSKRNEVRSLNTELVIDASFHRYGKLDDFDNYLFVEVMDSRDFEREKFTNITGSVNSGVPILIKNDQIVVLSFEDVEGIFDRENFSISLITKNKNKFATNNLLFMLSKQGGKVRKIENKSVGEYLLTYIGYHELSQRIIEWFNSI
jgi:hypothetical protein